MTADTVQNWSNNDLEVSKVIRVLLVDDHALVREGTRRLLETENDVEVIAEAASGEEAVEATKRFHAIAKICFVAGSLL